MNGKRGKRGSKGSLTRFQRSIRAPKIQTPDRSADSIIAGERAIYHEIFDPSSVYDLQLTPDSTPYRQSITERTFMGRYPIRSADTPLMLRTRQLDHSPHAAPGTMIETSDPLYLSRPTKTLLIQGKPTEKIGRFTRITSKLKRRTFITEVKETPIEPGSQIGVYTPDDDLS